MELNPDPVSFLQTWEYSRTGWTDCQKEMGLWCNMQT